MRGFSSFVVIYVYAFVSQTHAWDLGIRSTPYTKPAFHVVRSPCLVTRATFSNPRALKTSRAYNEDQVRADVIGRRELIAGTAAAITVSNVAGAKAAGIGSTAELSQQLEVLQSLIGALVQDISAAKQLATAETSLIKGIKEATKISAATKQSPERKAASSGAELIGKLTAARAVAQAAGEAVSKLEFAAAADAAGFQASTIGAVDVDASKKAAVATAGIQQGAAKARLQLLAAGAALQIANSYAVAAAKATAKLPEDLTGVKILKKNEDFVVDVQEGGSQKQLKGASLTVALVAAGRTEGSIENAEKQVQEAAKAILGASSSLVEPFGTRIHYFIPGFFALVALMFGVAGNIKFRKKLRASTAVNESLLAA